MIGGVVAHQQHLVLPRRHRFAVKLHLGAGARGVQVNRVQGIGIVVFHQEAHRYRAVNFLDAAQVSLRGGGGAEGADAVLGAAGCGHKDAEGQEILRCAQNDSVLRGHSPETVSL